MEILKTETRSLCNVCYEEIPARVFSQDSAVFLEKTCPIHGYFKALLEKDIHFYKRFYHPSSVGPAYFECLTIPITFRCNMYCKFCYIHNCKQKDYDLAHLERIIGAFAGCEIGLSGGEPTLREDLIEIIKIVKRAKKICILITNGLKLADRDYLCKLKQAGLDRIFFSLDSLKPLTYEIFKAKEGWGKKILDLKMQALKNIEKENMKAYISSTLYPGANDKEIKDLLLFCLKNNHFVFNFRIRGCAEVGRFTHKNKLFLSELLRNFSDILGVDKDKLLSKCLKQEYHTIQHIRLCIKGLLVKERFFPFISNEKNRVDRLRKFIFILSALLKVKPNDAIRTINNLLTKKDTLKYLNVRLICWPTKENFDLLENDRGIAHLYDGDKIAQFCHGIIMLDKPSKIQEEATEAVNK